MVHRRHEDVESQEQRGLSHAKPVEHRPGGAAAQRSAAWRLFAYALVTAVVFECVVMIATGGNAVLLGREYGPVECFQFVLALLAGGVLLAAARSGERMAAVLTIAALAAWFAAAREADRFFADLLFSDANKIVMTALAAVAALVAMKRRSRVVHELAILMETPGFQFLFVGWLVVVVYAQIIGQQELWKAVMGESYLRDAKNTLEELPELFGYLLLMFGAVEAWILERSVK